MFQFADNWEETYSCYESIKKGNNRVHDRETTSFSVLILIVLPEKKKKRNLSQQFSNEYHVSYIIHCIRKYQLSITIVESSA